jgi:hypothetical protein
MPLFWKKTINFFGAAIGALYGPLILYTPLT